MDKRSRGENWTAEDKEIFIELMKFSARIIERKNTDTNSNKIKQTEWFKVQKKFEELTGKLRDIAQLKGFWRRTRMVAKKRAFQHRRALHATGGGEKPPSPLQEDQMIMDMCPTDFVTEENEFDSDSIFYKNETEQIKEKVFVNIDTDTQIAGPSQQEDSIVILHIEDETQEKKCANHTEIIVENVLNKEVASKRAYLTALSDKENCYEENMTTPHRPQKSIERTKNRSKTEKSHKAVLLEANMELKEKTYRLLEEEYALKLQYQRQELCHQELMHKLEIDILLLEKQKKEWEVKLLKK